MALRTRNPGRRPCALVPLAGFLLMSSAAHAADWSIKANLSETLQFSDNNNFVDPDVVPTPTIANPNPVAPKKDSAVTVTKSASVDVLAEAKTYLLRLSPGVSASADFFLRDQDVDWDLFPSITAEARKTTKFTTYGISASASRAKIASGDVLSDRPNSVGQFDILAEGESGAQIAYNVGTSIDHKLSPLDTLSWTTSYSTVDYDLNRNTLQEYTSYGTTLSWSRQLTELTTMNLSGSVEFYNPRGRLDPIRIRNNEQAEDRWTFSPNLSVNTRLTKRVSAGANIGAAIIDEKGRDATVNWLAGVNVGYTLNETQLSWALSRNSTTQTDGTVQANYSASFKAQHQVNELTALNVASTYTLTPGEDGSPDEHAFSFAPAISYKFAKDWNSSLSYEFNMLDDGQSEIYENSVFLNVSYGYTLLP
jgi:hypothetical protein